MGTQTKRLHPNWSKGPKKTCLVMANAWPFLQYTSTSLPNLSSGDQVPTDLFTTFKQLGRYFIWLQTISAITTDIICAYHNNNVNHYHNNYHNNHNNSYNINNYNDNNNFNNKSNSNNNKH